MPAGLQIFNDDVEILIDSEYRNYVLDSKQTLSLTLSTYPQITIEKGEMLAFRCSSLSTRGVGCIPISQTSTTVTYQFYLERGAAATVTVMAYIFRLGAANTDAGTFGLNVFDAAGALVYSSNAPTLKVLYGKIGTTGNTDTGELTYSGKTVAVIAGKVPQALIPNGTGAERRVQCFANASAASVRYAFGAIQTIPGQAPVSPVDYTYNFLVLDVTGY
jgi:hypothetical protein